MARQQPQPEATKTEILECIQQLCPSCGYQMWNDYDNYRRIRTLTGVVQLQLKIRRCATPECERFHKPYRPEAEGTWGLPQQEFGLDIIALVGALRHQQHRSVGEIHQHLQQHHVCISPRSVSNLLWRYDELVALQINHPKRLKAILTQQQQVILAIDGLQPDKGHEVLWVIRECLNGEILLARTLLSATQEDLATLLKEVQQWLPVPIIAVVSDGQLSIRKAVSKALPEALHGLCQYHYLREAAKLIYEADRHAKKELKKRVRGVRAIERTLTELHEPTTEVVSAYCQAVRAALSADGRPPLDAAGLHLQQRLSAIEQSVERVAQRGNSPTP